MSALAAWVPAQFRKSFLLADHPSTVTTGDATADRVERAAGRGLDQFLMVGLIVC